MRKCDDVWVERKHILESEYANVKHIVGWLTSENSVRYSIQLKTATQSYSLHFIAIVCINIIKLVPQKNAIPIERYIDKLANVSESNDNTF